MDQALKQNKAALRSFMRAQYSDDRLVMLLDHARAGKLNYESCCCFIGIATADHELQELFLKDGSSLHYDTATYLPGAREAEAAFLQLHRGIKGGIRQARLLRLVPMILAELKRRRARLPEVPEDGHELWLAHSSEGFYVQG